MSHQVTMVDLQFFGIVEKLNHHNYSTWHTCMESYLQGKNLREIVGGSDTKNAEGLQKRRINLEKTMFVIKTTIKKEMLKHI
jgi:hypothetical protein